MPKPRQQLLPKLSHGSVGMEIGVWEGDFSQQLLDHFQPKRLYLVDPWQHDSRYPERRYGIAGAEAMEQRYQRVQYRFRHHSEVVIVRKTSGEIWTEIEALDWVYVDGNHSFEYVLAYLKGAHSRLRPGGILAGDDCHLPPDDRWPGVFQAVMAFLRSREGRQYEVIALQHRQFVLRKPTRAVSNPRVSRSQNSTDQRLFAILSQPRSGTHLLRNLLHSQPDVCCEGELFHPRVPIKSVADFTPQKPAREVLKDLMNSREVDGRHFGFPVHDSGGPLGRRFCWDHEELLNWKPAPLVIWLYRRNRLAQYASWLSALESGRWSDYSGKAGKTTDPARKVGPFSPNPEEFAQWLERQETRRQNLKAKLQSLPSIEIAYEDLCKNPERTCAQIFHKLGLPPVPVETPTRKMRNYRLQEIFTNFEDLVRVHREVMEQTNKVPKI
ncbi:MAG: class I SAM-dependent methyltransferase [Verrucomicrobiales bacterium]|nr:class I SAM-dependent methyltransferase [Verrucomicrobiales bacterium]